MRGEMVLIGDELLNGRIGDTNARYAANALWALDIGFGAVQMVGDNPNDIAHALNLAKRADFVIVSGGLGPTEDDITNVCAARFFNLPVEEHPVKIEQLYVLAAKRKRPFNQANRHMAMMPKGVRVLDKICAGWFHEDAEGRPWFFLPGVPFEFTRMIDEQVLPYLTGRFVGKLVGSRYLTVFGVTEAEVGRRIGGLATEVPGAGIGYYPVFPEEKLIITVRADNPEELNERLDILEEKVCTRLGHHVVVRGPGNLEELVGRLLRERGLTLAVAESCSGGGIARRVSSVAGASEYFDRGFVTYSNQSKIDLLGVEQAILTQHGAVSEACARAMAMGARRKSGTDVGLAVTGIAGPGGGSEEKPVGTVYLALAAPQGVVVEKKWYTGGRDWVQTSSAEGALDLLRRYLEGMLSF